MLKRHCLNHKERPATTNCSQCHKPVCAECVVTMAHGIFCSMECSVSYQAFQRSKKSHVSMMPSGTMALAIIMGIVFIVFILLHVAASYMPESPLREKLRNIDFIGRLLNRYEEHVREER